MKIGERIKSLRKQNNMTQKAFAERLGVTLQTVLKWEGGYIMPAFSIIPEIAASLGIPTKELFDMEKFSCEEHAINREAAKYYEEDIDLAESILREGLRRFPENEWLEINLFYVLDGQDSSDDEMIALCKKIVKYAKYQGMEDSTKCYIYRALARCYKEKGQENLVSAMIEKIPDIDFTRTQVEAQFSEGEMRLRAANKQKYMSADALYDAFVNLAYYWAYEGNYDESSKNLNLAQKLLDALRDDFFASEEETDARYDDLEDVYGDVYDILRNKP